MQITYFDEVPFTGIYLGPSKKFDDVKQRYQGRFVLNTGIINDIDLGNPLVWKFDILCGGMIKLISDHYLELIDE